MGYSDEIYSIAQSRLGQHRAYAEMEASQRREEYNEEHPEYARVTRELSMTSAELAKRIFASGAGSADITDIREKNLRLQQRAQELLAADGLTEEYFLPKYNCPLCEDTGVYNHAICDCMRKLMKKIAYDRLNASTPLAISSFDTFSLEHYPEACETAKNISPKLHMSRVLRFCRDYAESFRKGSQSLLMQGGVGLGKTHLSLAIAGRAIERGFDVIYGSAHSLFAKIENEKFGRDTSGDDTITLVKECDLLIMDDLGAEFSTNFTISVLTDIVNTRLLTFSPTIISTNLTLDGLTRKYDERVVSRIAGDYRRVQFIGSDMRFVLRKARERQPQ